MELVDDKTLTRIEIYQLQCHDKTEMDSDLEKHFHFFKSYFLDIFMPLTRDDRTENRAGNRESVGNKMTCGNRPQAELRPWSPA